MNTGASRRGGRTWSGFAAVLATSLVACSKAASETSAAEQLRTALAHKSTLDADAVGAALEAIAKSPQQDAVPLVIELARDRSVGEEVRFAAVHVLGRVDGAEARTVLQELAANDTSELVREEASIALSGKKGGP